MLSAEAAMSPIVPGFPTPTDPAYYNSCGPAPTSLRSLPPPPPPASLPALLPNINPAAAGSGCKGGGGGGCSMPWTKEANRGKISEYTDTLSLSGEAKRIVCQ